VKTTEIKKRTQKEQKELRQDENEVNWTEARKRENQGGDSDKKKKGRQAVGFDLNSMGNQVRGENIVESQTGGTTRPWLGGVGSFNDNRGGKNEILKEKEAGQEKIKFLLLWGKKKEEKKTNKPTVGETVWGKSYPKALWGQKCIPRSRKRIMSHTQKKDTQVLIAMGGRKHCK